MADDDDDDSRVLYRASFHDQEDAIVGYETAQWLLLSLVLVLAWGVGLLMLLYLPFRRIIVRRNVRSRSLYITANAIVYKVEKFIILPCFGVYRREKHILLSLVTDVAIEQGCLQSIYGIHSISIENASPGKPPPGDDLQILGVDDPKMFRREVLRALSVLRKKRSNIHTNDAHVNYDDLHEDASLLSRPSFKSRGWHQGTGLSSWQIGYNPIDETILETPSVVPRDTIMRKLDDIGNSIKRIEVLVEQPRMLQEES